MVVQEQCRPLHGEQFRDKQKACKISWLTYALCAGPLYTDTLLNIPN